MKISSLNARKHGLLVKDVVITNRAGKEDQAEFDALLAELRDDYTPHGIAQDLLVRELAVSYWKSARSLRCERADVTCSSDERMDESDLSELELSSLELQPPAQAYHSQLRSSRGIKFLLRKLEQARDEAADSGSLSKELVRWIAPGKNWSRIASSGKKPLIAALEKEIENLKEEKGRVEDEEAQWRNDRRDFSAIPSKETLERIQRYETSNVRHRYRVEARLQQLQSQERERVKAGFGRHNDTEGHQEIQSCETKAAVSGDDGLRKSPQSVEQAEGSSADTANARTETRVKGGG
jgi:hypothetical protein